MEEKDWGSLRRVSYRLRTANKFPVSAIGRSIPIILPRNATTARTGRPAAGQAPGTSSSRQRLAAGYDGTTSSCVQCDIDVRGSGPSLTSSRRRVFYPLYRYPPGEKAWDRRK